MQNRPDQPPLVSGDIIIHRSWGIGRIDEITSGPERRVILKFNDGTLREMSLKLAMSGLKKLPVDGLSAEVSKNREALLSWEKDAPLKLVGLALRDLSGTGKAGDIRHKLEGYKLLSGKWETWWKRVQPVLKQSPAFRAWPDGLYELVVSPDQIAAAPAHAISRKKEPCLSRPELLELLSKVERGEIKFEDVAGSKTRHVIARELSKRTAKYPQVEQIIISSLHGPVVPARIMLVEYVKKADIENQMKMLVALLDHIIALMYSQDLKDTKGVPEQIVAKLNLFRETLTDILSRRDSDFTMEGLLDLAKRLLDEAVQLADSEPSVWRRQVVDTMTQSLGRIAIVQMDNLITIGRNLAIKQAGLNARESVAECVIRTVPVEKRNVAIKYLLAGTFSFSTSTDLTDRLIQSLLPREHYIEWLADNVRDIAQLAGSDTSAAMNNLLERIGLRISPENVESYIRLVMAIALLPTRSGSAIPEIGSKRISEWAKLVDLESVASYQSGRSVLSPIIIAIKSRVKKEQDGWEQVEESMKSENNSLRDKIMEYTQTVSRLESVIGELKSGYRMPEKWTEYRAKKDILEKLGILYQEIIALWQKQKDIAGLKWITQQIETILIRNGASVFGDINRIVMFNPSQYEFISGSGTSEKEVRVLYPGFMWKDPASNSIVLVRAKVGQR